jgi:hypothetical protein
MLYVLLCVLLCVLSVLLCVWWLYVLFVSVVLCLCCSSFVVCVVYSVLRVLCRLCVCYMNVVVCEGGLTYWVVSKSCMSTLLQFQMIFQYGFQIPSYILPHPASWLDFDLPTHVANLLKL